MTGREVPAVWWSPSLAEDLSQGGLIERTGPDLWHQEHGTWHRLAELPADAVRLVPATLNSELKVGAVPHTGQARADRLADGIRRFADDCKLLLDYGGLDNRVARSIAQQERNLRALLGTDTTPKAGDG